MGTRISISYRVPVQVIVDVDEGTVDRVVVIDEEIKPDPNGFVADFDNFGVQPPGVLVEHARQIADAPDIDWPSWEHGF